MLEDLQSGLLVSGYITITPDHHYYHCWVHLDRTPIYLDQTLSLIHGYSKGLVDWIWIPFILSTTENNLFACITRNQSDWLGDFHAPS